MFYRISVQFKKLLIRQTDGQTDRRTDTQTDRQTDGGQTEADSLTGQTDVGGGAADE